jgi:hypothetical protein
MGFFFNQAVLLEVLGGQSGSGAFPWVTWGGSGSLGSEELYVEGRPQKRQ